MRITISGPSASGKGTVSRRFAQCYGLLYVDIGLIFRCSAFFLHRGTVRHVGEMKELLACSFWEYLWDGSRAQIRMGNATLEKELSDPLIAEQTSELAAEPEQFAELVDLSNQIIGSHDRLIVDGRSAGTIFLASADAKFYLDAHVEVRARRRLADLRALGYESTYEDVLRDLGKRDARDKARQFDPLIVPSGAEIIVTDRMTCEDVVTRMHASLKRIGFDN